MNKRSFTNYLIFISFSLGVLLPVRLAFSEFVSDYWLGNLGVITATGASLLFLARKNKLGKLGKIFENQLMQTIRGRTGKYILLASTVFLIYFGTTLLLIDRGNTVYGDDKEVFYAMIKEDHLFDDSSEIILNGPLMSDLEESIQYIQFFSVLEYAFSITYAIMDETSQGWLSHLYYILFVEQIEIIGLLLFFRGKVPLRKIITNGSV